MDLTVKQALTLPGVVGGYNCWGSWQGKFPWNALTTDCKARTQMKAMWLLCLHSQEKLPYSLAGVDSNDVLFPTPAEKSA